MGFYNKYLWSRFLISALTVTWVVSLCPTIRMRSEEDKVKALSQKDSKTKPDSGVVRHQGKTEEKMGVKELKDFKPSIGECVFCFSFRLCDLSQHS